VEFHKRGLKAEGQVPITVKYKDEVVGEYFADIVVEDKIIYAPTSSGEFKFKLR